MAPILHCKKCHSTSVYKDKDSLTGLVSIGCVHCGNRWPGGEGFYMADDKARKDEPMSTQKNSSGHKIASCHNCGRELPIMGHGLCGGCYGVYKKHSGNAEGLADALVKAKARYMAPGYQRTGGKNSQAPAEAPADPVEAKPVMAKRESFRQAADSLRQRLIKFDSPAHPDLMFIRIHIEPDDYPLIDEFAKMCRRQRRTMEGQILAMIDELVSVSQCPDKTTTESQRS